MQKNILRTNTYSNCFQAATRQQILIDELRAAVQVREKEGLYLKEKLKDKELEVAQIEKRHLVMMEADEENSTKQLVSLKTLEHKDKASNEVLGALSEEVG